MFLFMKKVTKFFIAPLSLAFSINDRYNNGLLFLSIYLKRMMKLLFGNNKPLECAKGTVATIGNFDGVHLGHQALLAQLRAKAREYNLLAVVVLFEPQPGEFFLLKKAPARLTSLREKLAQIKQSQLDYVYCLRFNEALAAMPPEVFAEQIIFSRLNVKWLLVGQDFRFGKDRAGDVNLLVTLGRKCGCTVVVFPDFIFQNRRVSSTLIRQCLGEDQLQEAASFLGRTYSVCGRVVHGQGIGRQWGIPTANIRVSRINSPINGIFCVEVLRSNGQLLQGVASLGTRPTVGGENRILEVNLFDFNDNLYGERLQVSFLHRLRDEVNFASLDALIRQIHEDLDRAKNYFRVEAPGIPA